jgi:uncharacterized protein (TIGR02246 family)
MTRALLASILVTGSLSGAAADSRPLAVTIDDLPLQGPAVSDLEREQIHRELLASLARHNIRAVGLVVWDNVRSEADRRILQAWLEAGHELGSHTATHPNYTPSSIESYLADVERARLGLSQFLGARGKQLRYFRFPMLNEGDTLEKLNAMRQALAQHQLENLHVTIDTQDWSFAAPWWEALRNNDSRALLQLSERYQDALRVSVRHHEAHGDALFGRQTPQILLLHANAVGLAQWDELFDWLVRTGHRFAPAEAVLADPAFREPHEFVFRHGVSFWDRIDHQREWSEVQQAITQLMVKQSAAWTAGELEAFCAVYAEDALFLAPSGVTRGRQAVLARYKARYPSTAKMGRLSLQPFELRPHWGPEVSMLQDSVPSSIHAVSVAAHWRLDRDDPEADLAGLTLIVFQRRGREWLIVQDASM